MTSSRTPHRCLLRCSRILRRRVTPGARIPRSAHCRGTKETRSRAVTAPPDPCTVSVRPPPARLQGLCATLTVALKPSGPGLHFLHPSSSRVHRRCGAGRRFCTRSPYVVTPGRPEFAVSDKMSIGTLAVSSNSLTWKLLRAPDGAVLDSLTITR